MVLGKVLGLGVGSGGSGVFQVALSEVFLGLK